MNDNTWDSIVIGGGVAGLSAAQALGRSLRRTLVIDAGSPRNRFASHMHNVLGLDGTPPGDLLERGRAEAARYGVEMRDGSVHTVTEADPPGDALRVTLSDGASLLTRSLVVATGITDELPAIPGLAEHWGTGVLHCPYCHGWEVRGRRIAVVATSPLSMHQVRMLRQWSAHVVAFTAALGEIEARVLRELDARGIVVEPNAVAAIEGDGERVTGVRTASGDVYPVDAVFAASSMVPHDGFLDGLGLERAETPVGDFIAVDGAGRTAHPRIWAAGNVVAPAATVPMSMGAGTMAGAAANGMLIEEDFANAVSAADAVHEHEHELRSQRGNRPGNEHEHAHGHATRDDASPHGDRDPREFWEQRYAGAEPIWSGRVNRALAEIVGEQRPARALDLGCGEGGDVIWLAERGWDATGLDLSETAIARARAAAADRGVPGARFIAADLTDWANDPASIDGGADPFDLVTASFLQSPVALERARILRAAADRVARGGRLVLISHAAAPSWAKGHPGDFPSPASELDVLTLDPELWQIDTAEVREREGTSPEGAPAHLEDTVVVAVRR